jgi:hypothetical protein
LDRDLKRIQSITQLLAALADAGALAPPLDVRTVTAIEREADTPRSSRSSGRGVEVVSP